MCDMGPNVPLTKYDRNKKVFEYYHHINFEPLFNVVYQNYSNAEIRKSENYQENIHGLVFLEVKFQDKVVLNTYCNTTRETYILKLLCHSCYRGLQHWFFLGLFHILPKQLSRKVLIYGIWEEAQKIWKTIHSVFSADWKIHNRSNTSLTKTSLVFVFTRTLQRHPDRKL